MLDIKTLMQIIRKNNEEKGWRSDGPELFMEKMMLIVSEISEAVEEFRDGKPLDQIFYGPGNPPKPLGIPIEIADAIIRILDWCEANNIDIEEALLQKMEYNESRPYRHGGKKV
jgi:NTP pyrophosphatase (non-canonical NTP hydrolase)